MFNIDNNDYTNHNFPNNYHIIMLYTLLQFITIDAIVKNYTSTICIQTFGAVSCNHARHGCILFIYLTYYLLIYILTCNGVNDHCALKFCRQPTSPARQPIDNHTAMSAPLEFRTKIQSRSVSLLPHDACALASQAGGGERKS